MKQFYSLNAIAVINYIEVVLPLTISLIFTNNSIMKYDSGVKNNECK